MLENLNNLDTQLLLFFNHLNNPVLDFLFYWISDKWIWVPFYFFLALAIFKDKRFNFLIVILFVAAVIAASDQIASAVIKENVMRLRPCHDPKISNEIHLVKGYCGGQYGFVSSHAANVFALASFLSELFKSRIKLMRIIWIWAAIVSFSRIYLGAHFPGDVICGGFLGVVLGNIFWRIFVKTNNKYQYQN